MSYNPSAVPHPSAPPPRFQQQQNAAAAAAAPRRAPPRPPPARQGAPPSTRDFGASSAGGVPGSLQGQGRGGRGKGVERGQTETQARKVQAWGSSYSPAEETIRNDYSSHYVLTGSRPQNHLRGAAVEERFAEYPKLHSLLKEKHRQLSDPQHSIPPIYLPSSPLLANDVLPANPKFDVILLSPPPEVTFEQLQQLDLARWGATPGFVWLWVGSGQRGDGVGLERGRELLQGWGFRRSEDIVWLKTNKVSPASDLELSPDSPRPLFTPTIEHCLMGIRGTVRRSNDPWFVHCNVDTDVIVWEGDDQDPNLKPPELQSLIENFCLGTRRLHLFGSRTSPRRGWLTVGADLAASIQSRGEGMDGGESAGGEVKVRQVEGEETVWRAERYERERWELMWRGREAVLPFDEELDSLRPKSPPRTGHSSLPFSNGSSNSSGGLGRGRGAGLGVTRSAVVPSGAGEGSAGRGRGRGSPPPLNQYFSGQHLPHFQHHHQQQQQQQYPHHISHQYPHYQSQYYDAPPPQSFGASPSFFPPPPAADFHEQQLAFHHYQHEIAILQQQQYDLYLQQSMLALNLGGAASFPSHHLQPQQGGYPIGGPGIVYHGAEGVAGQMDDANEQLGAERQGGGSPNGR